MPRRTLAKSQYEALASLRFALREFLGFSQVAARREGLPPQQHQALLALKGHAGPGQVNIGDLAGRLQLKHHSAVGLVDRLERRGLLRRVPSREDRRRVALQLTKRGETIVERLSAVHFKELKLRGPQLHRLIGSITNHGPARTRRKAR